MVKQIQLEHRQNFSCRLTANGKLIKDSRNKTIHEFEVSEFPAHCKIEIDPWRIQPLIRIDGQLVNYGLAKITPWDHMLEFTLPENFLEFYFENILESKKQYLKVDTHQLHQRIGYNQLHEDITEQITKRL